jgi:hypothetical protein
MTVDIELFGQLASGEQRRQTLTLETPMPVYDVARLIGVNPEEVGIVTIDGIQSFMKDVVPLTCRLCFFPPMTGG